MIRRNQRRDFTLPACSVRATYLGNSKTRMKPLPTIGGWGWEWTNADQAFDDPVFLREPQTLPAGESLVWALAAESGQFKDRLRYPGEDDVYEKPKMDALGL